MTPIGISRHGIQLGQDERYAPLYIITVHRSRGDIMRQKSTGDLVRTSASIPKELYEKLEKRANAERRSISSEIVVLLELALEKAGK